MRSLPPMVGCSDTTNWNSTMKTMTRLGVLGAALFAANLGAQGPAPSSKAAPVFVDGMAQVVPAFQDTTLWIRQHLWVETSVDSDRDGKKDRVHVDVTRPGQTESERLKVSIVYQ